MNKRTVAAALIGLAMLAPAAPALANDSTEAALRQNLQAATWPADIVRLADDYLARYPNAEYAGTAAALSARAGDAMRALNQKQVRLYRSAFVADAAPASDDTRRAALADATAAMRLAHLHRSAEGQDAHRYVGWLQYASALGSERAAYELAVHYRVAGQPVLAAQYETRAVEGGFVPPTWLDNVRK